MSLKAVLFDFDLTLADSTLPILDCVHYALEKMGLPARSDEEIRPVIGLSLHQKFCQLTGVGEIEQANEFSRLFVERADVIMIAQTEIYPYVAATLQLLTARGYQVAIVSNKFRYRIQSILQKAMLDQYVKVIVGAEDVKRYKPEPDGLILALELLGVHPLDAVYVGDHTVDSLAAKNAGVRFIGATTGPRSAQTWSSSGHPCWTGGEEHIIDCLDAMNL